MSSTVTPPVAEKTTVKNKLISVKNHVIAKRGRYAALATLTGCVIVNTIRVKQVNEFLSEKGLLDEFYSDPADVEN